MVCLEAPSYKPRMLRRFWQSLGVPSQKSKLSSAKRKCETYTPPRHEAMACSWPDTVACHNNEDNPSTQRRKRYRERGSPCLIPRVWMICPLGSPLFSTEYEAHRFHSQFHPLVWQPYFEHNLLKEISFHSIICFANIQLDRHMANLSFPPVSHTMKHLICHYSIVRNQSIRYKSALRVGYDIW